MKVTNRELRRRIRKIINEATVEPKKVKGPIGSDSFVMFPELEEDRVAEDLIQAADATNFEESISILSKATLSLPTTPEYLRRVCELPLVISQNSTPTGNNNLVNAANNSNTTSATSYGDAYEFSSRTPLGQHILNSNIYQNGNVGNNLIMQHVMDSGNKIASKLGDQFEFVFAALCLRVDPTNSFFALKGQQQGKDIIDGDGNILEAKFSQQKFDKRNMPLRPGHNKQFNATPPITGVQKYFIFMTENLPDGIKVVREDILFKFIAIAGRNIPDLVYTTFDETEQLNRRATIDQIKEDWDAFREFLVKTANAPNTDTTNLLVKHFMNELNNSADVKHINYLITILDLTLLEFAKGGLDDETYQEQIENLDSIAEKFKQTDQRRSRLNRYEKGFLTALLQVNLPAIQRLFFIAGEGATPGAEGKTVTPVGTSGRQSFSTTISFGGDFKSQLVKKDGRGIVYFVYAYLRNPRVSLEEKVKLIDFLSNSTRTSKGYQSTQKVIADPSAKQLALQESYRNKDLVQQLADPNLTDEVYINLLAANRSPIQSSYMDRYDNTVTILHMRLLDIFDIKNDFIDEINYQINLSLSMGVLNENKIYENILKKILYTAKKRR